MKRLMRSALSDLSFAGRRLVGRNGAGLRILMYHRVTDAHPGDRLCVPPARFAQQMQWLRERGYRTLSLGEAVDWVSAATSDKRHVTCDQSQSSPSKISLVAGRWSLVTPSRRQGSTEARTPVTGRLSPVAPERMIVLTFDDGFEDNFLYAHPAMERCGFAGCFFVPSGWIEAGEHGVAVEDRPMSWAQLRTLLQQGHEIGAHSVSHRRLTTVSGKELSREVADCKQTLEQRLSHPIDSFCYPAGDYDGLVKQAVERCGYLGACTVEPGANVPGGDPFALRRTEISAFDTLWDFEKKLAGAYDWLHSAVQRLRARSEA